MKMETVQEELRKWGEVMITTAGGDKFEIHLGDTEFDLNARVIRFKTPTAEFMIDGDSVESLRKHYAHPDTD